MTCPMSQPETGGDATKILVSVVGFRALREHVSAMQLVSVTNEGSRLESLGEELAFMETRILRFSPVDLTEVPRWSSGWGRESLQNLMDASVSLSHDQIWSCQRLCEAGLVSSITLVYSIIYTHMYILIHLLLWYHH